MKLRSTKLPGTKLKTVYPDGKVPSEETLIKKRNEWIEQRDKSNVEYKAVKAELKDIDYARQAIEDYLRMQRNGQQKQKDNLE